VLGAGIPDRVELRCSSVGVVLLAVGFNATPGLLDVWLTCGPSDRRRMATVPKNFPPEFKGDVLTVARRGDSTVAEVAADFDVSVESVRRSMRQADVNDGTLDGLPSSEQTELVRLRRDKRRLEMENEILRRAAAYFARDSLP
jgi:transposase